MRRLLAVAVLFGFLPRAHGQDKGTSEFSAKGEFRARYFLMDNPGADEDSLSNTSATEGRFKVNLKFRPSERVSATLTALHNANFGHDRNDGSVANSDPGTSNSAPPSGSTINDGENLLSVNEAYGTWLAADDLTVMIGRMNLQVGDGTLMGLNDWQKLPYAWEGLLLMWEQDFGKHWFAALKLRNLQINRSAASTLNTSASRDPEHNAYMYAFDLKGMADWLKIAHFHFLKNNSDALDSNSSGTTNLQTTTDGVDTIRYGTNLELVFGSFDLKGWYEIQSGKMININNEVRTEYDYAGSLWAAELGFSAANFLRSRFFAHYHSDSGDGDRSDPNANNYDPFASELHGRTGMMDILAWGNLTMWAFGWTFKSDDKTDFGLKYNVFKRTESASVAQGPTAGLYGNYLRGTGLTAANDKENLGEEIDLWATYAHGNGLESTIRLGYFMPGDYFEDSSVGNDDKILHFMVEGRATF